MKFPQLYRIVATDELRPQICVARVTKTYTYATNAHVLARHITEKIFDEVFVANLPENGIAIPYKALKAICSPSIDTVELSKDKKVLILKRSNWEDPDLHFNLPLDLAKFPNYDSVMFNEKDAKPVSDICLSSKLFSDLMKAMDPYGSPFLNMFFSSKDKAILVKLRIDSDFYGADGVIMPAMY